MPARAAPGPAGSRRRPSGRGARPTTGRPRSSWRGRRAAGRRRSGRGRLVPEVEGQDSAETAHLARRQGVRGVVGQARVARRAGAEQVARGAGDGEGVGALSLQPHVEVASERWSSQTSWGPGMAPPCRRHSRGDAPPGRGRAPRRARGSGPSARCAPWCPRRPTGRRRGRAAGPAASPGCCRRPPGRRRGGRPRPARRCRRRRGPGHPHAGRLEVAVAYIGAGAVAPSASCVRSERRR
jgi:hypothetical protein